MLTVINLKQADLTEGSKEEKLAYNSKVEKWAVFSVLYCSLSQRIWWSSLNIYLSRRGQILQFKIHSNVLYRFESYQLTLQTCPTYTSCQSSCFVRWKKARSEQRAVQDCEPPSPPLWTCCGCLCWGCWHSVGLAGPPCCGSPPHGGPCTLMTPASWLLAGCPNCRYS